MNLSEVLPLADAFRAEIRKAVIGQDETVDLLLTCLFANGHMLLEGPPGTAKTFLARSFATTLQLDFKRIQFTPDLMPGDVIGANIFDFRTSEFRLTKGPIFTEILLADEINRTPPKTQAALLEAMQERTVTIDGGRHQLSERFMVVATQNPIEQQGTYPLPEAQLDRFLFKHVLDYPSLADEVAIVASHGSIARNLAPSQMGVKSVASAETIASAIEAVRGVKLSPEIVLYIVNLVRATRENASFQTGASPRAAAMLAVACRARAALQGRDYVLPDDIKALAKPALCHRVILSPVAEIEGLSVQEALSAVIEQVEVPR